MPSKAWSSFIIAIGLSWVVGSAYLLGMGRTPWAAETHWIETFSCFCLVGTAAYGMLPILHRMFRSQWLSGLLIAAAGLGAISWFGVEFAIFSARDTPLTAELLALSPGVQRWLANVRALLIYQCLSGLLLIIFGVQIYRMARAQPPRDTSCAGSADDNAGSRSGSRPD